jgi:ABC-2 type transport system ATP-binding protein
MNEFIVSVRDLSKHYGETKAASKLNFDILHGECFGMLGPNGAGKTTTIGMLTGLIDPTEGWVKIDGIDLQSDPLQAKAKLGFVPQDFAFYPTLSAKDNLLFFGRIYGLRGRQLKRRIENVLQSVELLDKAGGTVSTFLICLWAIFRLC